MIEALSYFHFLRPWWLILIPVIGFLWWRIRPHRGTEGGQTAGLAPHLAQALQVGTNASRRVLPIDGVALGGLLLAVAGPAWDRIPNPLVVVLKVTESMEMSDLAPSRLERARFKVLDLVEARAGARTAPDCLCRVGASCLTPDRRSQHPSPSAGRAGAACHAE